MKFLHMLFFYLLFTSLFGATTQNIVKVNVTLNFHSYITYVIISTRENPTSFTIIRESI